MMSDGAIHAGVGTVLNFGWQQPEIAEYAQRVWTPELSAKSMAAKISDACRELYMDIPGDDTTVAALRIRQRQQVNLMIGPPRDPAEDEAIMKDFFALEGKTIVCGGTTSTVVGRYLGKPVCPTLDFFDPDIPPIATIQGVDLCTEGVITLGRVVALAALTLIAIICWFGWDYTKRGGVQSMAGLESVSMFWAYLAMPVGSAFCAIGIIGNLIDPLRMDLETAQ